MINVKACRQKIKNFSTLKMWKSNLDALNIFDLNFNFNKKNKSGTYKKKIIEDECKF